jgi:hypothetical protein
MREDMSRVIVERPRRGGGWGRKGRAIALENLHKHEGIRRRHVLSGDWKTLNENLAPLRRYLERQVGRPWNKVYSEIALQLRADNTVQQHVRDHIGDYVAINPQRRSGCFYAMGGANRLSDRLWFEPLYVDPNDGLLKRTDRLPEAKALRRLGQHPPKPVDRIGVTPDRELRRLGGLWFEVILAQMPEPEYRACHEVRKVPLKPYSKASPTVELEMTVRRLATPAVIDVTKGGLVQVGPEIDDARSWVEYRRLHPDRRYAVSKRALSRGELKRHGLRNFATEG